jgi:RNA polymerase sigma factor (sigma-70 family)
LTVPIAVLTVHRASVTLTDPISPALDAVVARFGRMLRFVARQRGVPEEELAEVIQNLRLRLWRAHPKADAIAGLGASYIYQTAISAALDVIRNRRAFGARHQTSLTLLKHDPPAPDGMSPAAVLEHAEDARTVAEAIRELSEARRVPVRMYLSGYTRQEIASQLGWSEAKTRNLLYRGLEDLRNELRRRGFGPEGKSG